jgi:hypothetical protein
MAATYGSEKERRNEEMSEARTEEGRKKERKKRSTDLSLDFVDAEVLDEANVFGAVAPGDGDVLAVLLQLDHGLVGGRVGEGKSEDVFQVLLGDALLKKKKKKNEKARKQNNDKKERGRERKKRQGPWL